MKLIKKYRPLFHNPPKTRYFIVSGGRGSGKSFAVSLLLLNLTYEKGHVILFTRWTLTSAYISIIPEFIQKIELLNREADFEITSTEIINRKTGSRILFRGIKTSQGTATANLKSIQGVTTWVLDEAEELTDEDVFDRINLSVRSTLHPNRVIMVMNPSYKGHFIYQRWIKEQRKDAIYIHTTYLDNLANLSESFIEDARRTKERNEARYNHIFLGHWVNDVEGLLWTRPIIEQQRLERLDYNLLSKICVAVDPATSKTMNSDETGIIVCGTDARGQYYILEDLSGSYSPNEWATVASDAAKKWSANSIVAEKNQGGDMVKAVIRQVDKTTHVKLVTATRGKAVRAEPIYSLYESGKVWHVGLFPILENQLISFNPGVNPESPDRVDALVWGVSWLAAKSRKLARGVRQ